jgi:hypothetical protein
LTRRAAVLVALFVLKGKNNENNVADNTKNTIFAIRNRINPSKTDEKASRHSIARFHCPTPSASKDWRK